jgi:hypothetical protein
MIAAIFQRGGVYPRLRLIADCDGASKNFRPAVADGGSAGSKRTNRKDTDGWKKSMRL